MLFQLRTNSSQPGIVCLLRPNPGFGNFGSDFNALGSYAWNRSESADTLFNEFEQAPDQWTPTQFARPHRLTTDWGNLIYRGELNNIEEELKEG